MYIVRREWSHLSRRAAVFVWKNYMNAVDLKEYLFLTYEVTCDGIMTEQGKIILQESILPRMKGKNFSSDNCSGKWKMLLKIGYHLKCGRT